MRGLRLAARVDVLSPRLSISTALFRRSLLCSILWFAGVERKRKAGAVFSENGSGRLSSRGHLLSGLLSSLGTDVGNRRRSDSDLHGSALVPERSAFRRDAVPTAIAGLSGFFRSSPTGAERRRSRAGNRSGRSPRPSRAGGPPCCMGQS